MGGMRGVNGVLIIDKPMGITSYDVVRELKPDMKGIKIGYLGTLDPLATGVLPLLLGEGTKLAPFLETGKKVYEATLHLGVTTDTQDKDGRILATMDIGSCDLSPQRIEEVMQGFRGTISQLPPLYSALKHNGEPLYKLARRGEAVQKAPREVEIYELHVMEIDPPVIHLYIECSTGTYIRTLGHDMGAQLGCGAHLTALRRRRNGPFDVEDALSLAEVKGLLKAGKVTERILSLSQAVSFLPPVSVSKVDAIKIHNGQAITVEAPPHGSEEEGGKVRVLAKKGGGLVAVGEIHQEKACLVVRPLRVFHNALFTKATSCGRNTVHTIINTMAHQGGR
jgi:tRNA pseudouridine55 synthase